MLPIIIFWTLKFGGVDRIDWLVPIFVLTTIFTLGTGPAQTVLAWRLAHRDIRRHRAWFLYYLLMSSLFYPAFKNLIATVCAGQRGDAAAQVDGDPSDRPRCGHARRNRDQVSARLTRATTGPGADRTSAAV